jgi:hypothetical protein
MTPLLSNSPQARNRISLSEDVSCAADNPPRTIVWSDIVDFDGLNERRASIDCLHANILGVNDGYVEWCSNDDPPSRDETLAWLRFIRPDLGSQIGRNALQELRDLIEHSQSGQMETWWKKFIK